MGQIHFPICRIRHTHNPGELGLLPDVGGDALGLLQALDQLHVLRDVTLRSIHQTHLDSL